jgi:drug/metabolite transporter (DMT)-like permease
MIKGILVGFLSYGVFACGDAAVKALGGRMTVFEIGFFTTIFAFVALPFARHPSERWRDILRMNRPGLVMVRVISGMAAGVLSVYSFTRLPLAEVYSLIFLAPLFVTMLSIPFLGETVGWRRSLAILIGFGGVLLVVRPGFRELHLAHLAAVGIALCGAATVLALRALGATEKRITLMGAVFFGQLGLNGALMLTDFNVPAPRDLTLIVAAGLCAGLGQMLLMAATRAAPASRIAPAQYSQIAWAVGLGAWFFGEIPDLTAIAGIALVTFAGLFTFAREKQRGVRGPAVWTMVWGRGRAPPSCQRKARSRP